MIEGGEVRALFRAARPAGLVLALGMPAMGYGMGLWSHASGPWRLGALLGVLGAWALLNAGTLWWNAALDRDESGAVFSGEGERPGSAGPAGLGALGAAVAVAWAADRGVGLVCLGCALLSLVYSHPRLVAKGHPVLGPAINAVGYGFLSPLAGWLVAEVPMDGRTLGAFLAMTLFVLGSTFAAQAFQREEDARRGYRTLVVTHGPAACLGAARSLTLTSLGAVATLAALGFYPRLCLLGMPAFVVADRWLQRWRRQPDGGSARWAGGWLLRMAGGGLLLIGLAYLDAVHDMLTRGEPAAGAATAAGRNPAIDRP
ncbi:MAG: UbiA family prenyltransferase [Polyangiaceae bacterium]|nr:UbiA family prenyltransferase [Polyangiaceae bacterium]